MARHAPPSPPGSRPRVSSAGSRRPGLVGRAFGHNATALPLAAAGPLHPMIAGLATALSSVFVASRGPRLRRFT
ncbi:hypothetical protein EF906_24850 [Streptomyces sp. WAC08241]|nr:hypothetical protein EF906_24850 [Streptomyces sp. WAC08241]